MIYCGEENVTITSASGTIKNYYTNSTYTSNKLNKGINIVDLVGVDSITLTNTNASLTNEIKLLKAQIQVDNSNCKKEFSKFVTSEVMSLVNETNDFESALKDYKKNNPQYFGETVITKTQTAPSLNNGGTQPQTTSNIMNNLIRGARNN